MSRSIPAISIALAGLLAPATFADTSSHAIAPSAYEYGNYDYYSVAQPAAPAPTNPAPATPAPAATDNGTCNAAASGSAACNSCGCDTCCDCCHQRLPHLLHCCWRLEPCFSWCDSCPLTCPDVTTCRLFDCCCLKEHDAALTGWIDGGIMGNSLAPATHFNGPVTFPDVDNGQLNQFYGILQRTPADMSKNCGWFLGGDVDFMWGSDYFFTTAAGLDGTSVGNIPRWGTSTTAAGGDAFRYGFAMPQLYAETDYDDLRIKWGHFYTIIGYEVVPAIGNFFYTHSYTMQYGEPFTHTGVLASRSINDNWSWSGGIVSGWNDFNFQD